MRSSLITALAACAENSLRCKAQQFLSGLSSDELQFIAEFLGGWMLQAHDACALPPAKNCSEDWELKLIVLREYLTLTALDRALVGLF